MKTVKEVSKLTGVKKMNFTAFDTTKIEEYTKQAKEQWGNTAAYKEFEVKHEKRSKEEMKDITKDLMKIFIVVKNK